MKQIIKLTESDLHNIIKNSVNKILKENNYKNKFNKIRAAAYAAGQGHNANDIVHNMLAKQNAIRDINKDLKKQKTNYYDDFIKTIKYNDLDITPEEGEDLLTVDY